MVALSKEQLMALPSEYLMEVNPSSRQLYNCAVGFIVIDTFVFGLFVASIYLHHMKFGFDVHVLIPLGYLAVLGNALVGILLVEIGGVGRHLAYHMLNDPTTITKYLQLQTGVEIIYIFVDRLTRALTWMMCAILVIFFLSGLILAVALCKPYAFKWDKTINGSCGDIMAGYQWIRIPSIITDFFILIIPIPTLWKLQMDKYKKLGVFVSFLTGGLGFVTAIVRCLTFYGSDLFADPTFLAGKTVAWTIVESSAYFICACLPRLRPLLWKVLKGTALSSTVTTTFRSVMNKRRDAQDGTVTTAKNTSTKTTCNDDTVGFVQLEELSIGSSR